MSTDLTPKAAKDFCDSTLKLKKDIENSFITLGNRLSRIKSETLWKGAWESWSEYCAEAKISEATASKLIQVYNTFVVTYEIDEDKLAEAGWSSLYEILPLATSKSAAEDLVEKAGIMKRDDLRDEVRESKHGVCKHPDTYEIHLKVCRICNHKESIHA